MGIVSILVGTLNRTRYHLVIMKLKEILFAALAVSLIGGLGLLWLAPERLTQAPDITLTTLQGKQLSIPKLQGGPVLVNFWATTCKVCLEEIPHLIELYQELAPRGFEVIGVAMAYDPPNRVIALSQTKRIPYPVALDIQGEAARAFGNVRLTPSSFLIAPDGRIIHRKTGELELNKIRGLVVDMLAQTQRSDRQLAVT
jgi:thiol-disulfide isomerase/thioredoxin